MRMSSIVFMSVICFFCNIIPGQGSEEVKQIKIISACKTETAPHIDGKLDDPCWQNAEAEENFILIGNKAAQAKIKTSVYMLYDDKNLYLAFRCEEPEISKLRKEQKKRNSPVWEDDCVEVFLSPGADQNDYFHLATNAVSTQYDTIQGDRVSGSVQWNAKSSEGTDFWISEMAIPFSDLGTTEPRSKDVWRINLGRERKAGGENQPWTWSEVSESFHEVKNWGYLIFGKDNMLIKEINAGNSELKLKLKNTAPGAADVLVDLSLLKNGKQVLSKKIMGKIDEKGVLSTSYNSLRPGTYTVNIVTRAAAGKKEECREFSFPLSLHDPNGFNMTTWPAEDHENVLYISSNIPQHFFVVLSNNSKTKNAISNIQFDIPECFELIVPKDINIEGYYKTYLDAATSSISKIKRGNTTFDRYTISPSRPLPKTDLEKLPFHQGMLLFIKLKNTHDLKEKENYEIYYKLLSDIETDQENCLKVVVFPEIRGKQPKSIKIIMETWACRSNLEQWAALMKAYQTIGVNSIQWSAWSNADKTYSDIAISNKMTLFSGMFYFYSNKKYLAEKPDCAAITFTGEKAKDSMICPTVMLADDAVIYKEMMKPFVNTWVKTNIAGVDWDLEGPRPWQTCFCKRCIDKFKKHIGIKEKENLTPSQIKDKYASAWVDFCCSQNTEACFILKEELNKHNISLGVYSSTSIPFAKSSYRIDWNELINHQAIDIAFLSFYSAAPSNLGTQFTGLLKNLIKNFKARSKYPLKCYTTLTTGYGRNQLVVRPPELTKLQILKSIAHGADGVTFWHWAANDGRHYRAIAEATQIIADFEDYFLTGKNEDELVKLSGAEDVSHSVWTKDNSRIIFVFNHSKTEKMVAIQNLNLSGDKISAWDYSEKKDIPIKDMTLTIKPLDVGIVLIRSGK